MPPLRSAQRPQQKTKRKRRVMAAAFNVTRLGEYLLKSSYTPENVREEVARKMKSKYAKDLVKELDARTVAGETMHETLHTSRKAANPGSASTKRDDIDCRLSISLLPRMLLFPMT